MNTEPWTVRLVVIGLITIATAGLVCTTVLIRGGTDATAAGLVAQPMAAAIGALAAVLATTGTKGGE